MRRSIVTFVAAAGLVMLVSALALAQGNTDGTLTLSEGSVAAGIGFSWGKGTLTYQGKTYPVKVDGLTVGEVGISRATATGKVTNLKKVADFSGTYTAGSAGATVGGGASAAIMKNQNGVVVELTSTTQGASLKLGAQGIKFTLDQ